MIDRPDRDEVVSRAWDMLVEDGWKPPLMPGDAISRIIARTPADGPEPVAVKAFPDEKVKQLLDSSLKPEEIAGPPDVQLRRVQELLSWFERYSRGNANPKWAKSHACELAYYIATTDARVAIDLAEIEKRAWVKGLNASPSDRSIASRLGLIPVPVDGPADEQWRVVRPKNVAELDALLNSDDDSEPIEILPDGSVRRIGPADAVSEAEVDLATALEDLLTWFPDKPSEPEWRLKAGNYGADDAIKSARAALEAAQRARK